MKSTIPDPPVAQVERSPLVLAMAIGISAVLVTAAYLLFQRMSGWAFIVSVPAVFLSFQTVWLLLNPFAAIFKGHVEFRRSLFDNRIFYFNDVQRVRRSAAGKWFIVYNDDETVPLDLRGIRQKDVPALMALFDKA